MGRSLPPVVAPRIDAYLDAVDEAVPGFVAGLYITGSIALDDYQLAISDIDAVAVCAGRPDAGQCAALAQVHAGGPKVDVLYATAEDLAADPRTLSLPCSILGDFKPADAFAANPVEWRTLSTKAFAVRGGPIDPALVWFDEDALRQWNLTNLDDYWVGKISEGQRIRPEFLARWESGLQWVVLGIPRLHHTIVTNDVISKSAAGSYALEIVDEQWHDVVRAAIALRADQQADLPKEPVAMVADAVAVAKWLIDDAHRLGGG
ncbi:MAG: aminoglycoside adenylyltransferase domain-containing protein [Acidimicrobiales bacterium]